jgi:hypothetical protein
MTSPTGRMVFALLCVLGMILLAGGLLFEIGRQKRSGGHTLVSPRQFRVRVISALVWMGVLGLFAYAMMFLWPTAGNTPLGKAQATNFILTMGAAVTLICVGIMLLCYDIITLLRAQRQHSAMVYAQFAETVRAEAENLREKQASGGTSSPAKGETAKGETP